MKYIMLILVCLLAVGSWQVAFAQWAGASASPNYAQPNQPQQKLVSLDLKDTPLKDAIETLFKDSGYDYVISPELNKPPFSNLQVNLKLQNVSFETALSSLTKAANLNCTREQNDGKAYTISPASPQPGIPPTPPQPSIPPAPPRPTYGGTDTPGKNTQPEPDKDLITMRIPAMRIIHALQKVDPGWGFSPENLENKVMPGASFYKFPREGAAIVLMIAAGLVPPSDNDMDKTITQSGKADLQDYFQWKPAEDEKALQSSGGGMGFGGYGGSSFGGGGGGGRMGFGGETPEPGSTSPIAIAAYNTADKGQRYVVLLSQALDIIALENLLAVSGRNYVMDDLRNRYAVSKITQSVGDGKLVESEQIVSKPWRYISAQLYNVTLDQALDNLINAAGLKYKKEGTGENITYVIENPTKAIWDRGAANSSTIKPAPKSSTVKPVDSGGFGGGGYGGGRMGF